MLIEPLSPQIGAVVQGINLRRVLAAETLDALRDALVKHHVLVFRDQPLDQGGLEFLGRQLGEVTQHPAGWAEEVAPGIIRVHTDQKSSHKAGAKWHADLTCAPQPPFCSLLHLSETPSVGGDTLFASSLAAYDDLSPSLQQFLKTLTAAHIWHYPTGDHPDVIAEHPVVITHPLSGRHALFVNESYTKTITQLREEESRSLLAFLFQHITQPRFACRIRWEKDSLVWWDNLATQHLALWDYHPQTRSGLRLTLDRLLI